MLNTAISEINKFDFDHRKCRPGKYKLFDTADNSLEENKQVMLRGLQIFCMSCRICPIGCSLIPKGDNSYDPHVFSTMSFKSKYMVVGQNPGINECIRGTPFIGDAGKNFDEEIAKNGLCRDDFYVTNTVKCFTRKSDGTNNRKPSAKEKTTCSDIFLVNEIKILQPTLIITLGESAFSFFCPNEKYSDRLGKITKSTLGKIYAIYHPSPMNINDPARRVMFDKQIKMLAKLIKKIG
jgi:DNA polymerase